MMLTKEIKKYLVIKKKFHKLLYKKYVMKVLLVVTMTFSFIATGINVYAEPDYDDSMGYIDEIDGLDGDDTISHNEKQIDSYTGEPFAYYDDDYSVASNVSMDENCIYEVSSYTYIYNYTDFAEDDIRANVYDGMIVNDTVSIEIRDDLNYQLYRNGAKVDFDDAFSISDPGYYMLQITTDDGQIEEPLSFTILGDYSNMINYIAPDGYQITKVMMGETPVEFTTGQVDFTEEGEYTVSYSLSRSGVEYTFHTTIDHTPPTLKLKELNKKNQARSAVSLKDYNNEDIISITLDGEKIDYSEKMTEYGQYHIVLQDRAGNMSEYDFVILVYVSGAGIAFMILFTGVFIGLAVYLKVSKKKLRVR